MDQFPKPSQKLSNEYIEISKNLNDIIQEAYTKEADGQEGDRDRFNEIFLEKVNKASANITPILFSNIKSIVELRKLKHYIYMKKSVLLKTTHPTNYQKQRKTSSQSDWRLKAYMNKSRKKSRKTVHSHVSKCTQNITQHVITQNMTQMVLWCPLQLATHS